ncbi:MAG: 3-deoxy-D-manno-octulosonic acid transferase [Verrucomicrobia bacterium]|nr:3-deoxy-D-manno-octulosonic acid transferase [Verrucomicrobiota bacterium]
MRALYNLLFIAFFVLSAPYYFWKMRRRGNWRRNFGQRFGRYEGRVKQALTNSHTLWLHAVSVGEVNLCTQLIAALEPRLPLHKFVVTTTTTTGMGELERKLPPHILRLYYPVDLRGPVKRALGLINPRAVVLVEAEIWPNFLWRVRDRGVPLFLVNARLSPRSFPRYKRFGFLFRNIFASFTGVGAQNESDAARLRELGCRPEAIRVVGNLKFDAARPDTRRHLDVPALLTQLGARAGASLLVAGSTHAGEEALLAEMLPRLRRECPDLFLVLVPRHMERGQSVGEELTSRGVKFAFRTDLTAGRQFAPGSLECLLVNTTGELKYFYEHATVIFVGKSLTAEGGQNPIEPGALGKAMLFGPHMENFPGIADAFVKAGGAVQVPDAPALETEIAALLRDEPRRLALGMSALNVVRENQGAVDRTVEMIVEHIAPPAHRGPRP